MHCKAEKIGQIQNGFTLVELVIVIVILGILAVSAAPRFLDISTDAKIASLNSIATNIKSTNKLVQYKARLQGISPILINPGDQSGFIVDFGFKSIEVHHSSLCPEAISELGDGGTFFDFMEISTGSDMTTSTDNQYVRIGYTLPSTNVTGCYVQYNSFSPSCEVSVVTTDC